MRSKSGTEYRLISDGDPEYYQAIYDAWVTRLLAHLDTHGPCAYAELVDALGVFDRGWLMEPALRGGAGRRRRLFVHDGAGEPHYYVWTNAPVGGAMRTYGGNG